MMKTTNNKSLKMMKAFKMKWLKINLTCNLEMKCKAMNKVFIRLTTIRTIHSQIVNYVRIHGYRFQLGYRRVNVIDLDAIEIDSNGMPINLNDLSPEQ